MRLVVKVGTSTLAHQTGLINIRVVEALCRTLADIKNSGVEVVLVTSGAIGMGVGKLHLPGRPKDMPSKQACAAVGQGELMAVYDRLFTEYGHTVGQVLLTGEDVANGTKRRQNVENTLTRLLELAAIPIINENDTVATEEIEIGDNDTLSAIVAVLVKADLLVLLSDIDGLYTADPRKDPQAKIIPLVNKIDESIVALAGGSGTGLGTGGMATKIRAAKIVMEHGIDMVIVHGKDPTQLYDIVEGKALGTKFEGGGTRA